ncbi:hypothetical protein ABBQ38_008928 [Trebouxia sp. C0009 RCD-2024]
MKTALASIQPICSVRNKSTHRARKRAAVQLRRGDLAFTPPPWHQSYDATAQQLHTSEVIRVVDSQACNRCEVHVSVEVSPVGAGYFLSGAASADLPLQCDCCLMTFWHPVAAPFKVWLDASLPEDAVPEDPCQLPFPPQMQAVDLGPAINDALQMALPSSNVCGQPDCSVQFAEVGESGQNSWSTTRQKSKSGQDKAAGPFAALLKLKKTTSH